MTWTRLDDTFADAPEWEHVSFEARWLYLALVQFCSRTKRYDGTLPLSRARGCSDVGDATKCLDELQSIGRVTVTRNEVTLPKIDEHIPPPSVRLESERAKLRMRRLRAHKANDHSLCLAKNCEHAPDKPVTPVVTGNTRTGQDGTGPAVTGGNVEPWPEVAAIPNANTSWADPLYAREA
jgi:hypothetical protein